LEPNEMQTRIVFASSAEEAMAGTVVSRILPVFGALRRRVWAYIALVSILTAVWFPSDQKPTAAEYAQGIGLILVFCEVTCRSVRILWRAYRFGLLIWVALAAAPAWLGVKSLLGGVSDDLPTIILGFGTPVFTLTLAVSALLVFFAGRAER
jgi:hypothetical protein